MKNLKYLLIPFIIPLAALWVFAALLFLLWPCLFLCFGLMAVGEGDKGEGVLDWCLDMAFFERGPFPWVAHKLS